MPAGIDIDETTGTALFVAGRDPAWHRLGDFEPGELLTVDDAGNRAHLYDWNQHLVPNGALVDPEDPLSWQELPSKRNVVRTNPLTGELEVIWEGAVGSRFRVWQNEQLAEFAQQIAGVFGDEKVVSAAGSMNGLAQVFITLELEGFTVLGDRHDQWLTVFNGNDGNTSLTGFTGATRVVCKNTMDWALAGTTNLVKVRHSGDMIAKADEAADLLGVSRDWAKEFQAMAERLAGRKMTEKRFLEIVRTRVLKKPDKGASKRTVTRFDNDVERLRYNFTESPTTESGRGTAWAGLNAVTEWAEWQRPGDNTTDRAAYLNLFGTPASLRRKAAKAFGAL